MTQPPPPSNPYQPPPAYPQVPVVPSAPPAHLEPIAPDHEPWAQQPQQHAYPPQPGYGYSPHVVITQALPTSGWAVASLVFGILGVLGGWCLFAIPCIIAVICGHAGMRDTNGGVKSGRGMAIAGLILGYLVVGPALLVTVMGIGGGLLPGSSTTP